MANRLKNLKVDFVSLVDHPANEHAVVTLTKRDDSEDSDEIEKAKRRRKAGGTGMAMGMQDSDDDSKEDDDEDDAMGKGDVEPYWKRDFSEDDRKRMAATGVAESDGSYPIPDRDALKRAIESIGRSSDADKTKRHIIARARALGATSMLPEDWKVSKTTQENTMTDVTKALPERATDANPDPDGDGDDDRTAAGDTDNSHFNSDGSRKPTMKADATETVTKADLETIRKQYEDQLAVVSKSLEDTTARAIAAETVAKAEAEQREQREAITKAEREYASLPGTTAADTGALMRTIAKATDAETVAKLEAILTAASVAVAKGDLFTEAGSNGNGTDASGAFAKLQVIAKGLRTVDTSLSEQQAIAKAVQLNPELAITHRQEAGFVPTGGYRQYR